MNMKTGIRKAEIAMVLCAAVLVPANTSFACTLAAPKKPPAQTSAERAACVQKQIEIARPTHWVTSRGFAIAKPPKMSMGHSATSLVHLPEQQEAGGH